MPPIVFVLLAAFVMYVLWTACQPRWTLRIIARPQSRPEIKGAALARVRRIEEFFENDIRLSECVTIYAFKDTSGRIRTKIRGPLDIGLQQRIRNFLHDIM